MNPLAIALIANGDIKNYSLIRPSVLRHSLIYAVDGGLIHCDRMQITPHLIVGDFDSAPPELFSQYMHVPAKRFAAEKDETDLELAIQIALDQKAALLSLFGVTGKRLDHTLANLNLASRYPDQVVIYNENETAFFLAGSKIFPCKRGQTLSILAWNGPARGITTEGLKWELKEASFDKHFFSQSNICLSETVTISCKEGLLLVCLEAVGLKLKSRPSMIESP